MFVLAGTREGLESPKESSVNSLVGVAAPSDPVGSFIVKILHSVEGGDIEQGCRTSKQISRACDCSLYLSLVFISCMLTLLISLYA